MLSSPIELLSSNNLHQPPFQRGKARQSTRIARQSNRPPDYLADCVVIIESRVVTQCGVLQRTTSYLGGYVPEASRRMSR